MIEAVEDTEVIIIPTSVLSQIMKENPRLKCICIKLPWNAFRMSCGQCSKFFYESGQKGCHFSVGWIGQKQSYNHISDPWWNCPLYRQCTGVVTKVLKYFAREGVVSLVEEKLRLLTGIN